MRTLHQIGRRLRGRQDSSTIRTPVLVRRDLHKFGASAIGTFPESASLTVCLLLRLGANRADQPASASAIQKDPIRPNPARTTTINPALNIIEYSVSRESGQVLGGAADWRRGAAGDSVRRPADTCSRWGNADDRGAPSRSSSVYPYSCLSPVETGRLAPPWCCSTRSWPGNRLQS